MVPLKMPFKIHCLISYFQQLIACSIQKANLSNFQLFGIPSISLTNRLPCAVPPTRAIHFRRLRVEFELITFSVFSILLCFTIFVHCQHIFTSHLLSLGSHLNCNQRCEDVIQRGRETLVKRYTVFKVVTKSVLYL